MNTQAAITLAKRYAQQIKESGIPIEQVVLFGSQAQDTAHPWSDIDVCVVSPLFGKDRHAERVMLMDLLDMTTELIEPHPYSPEDFHNTLDPLANEIRRIGIVVA